MVLESVEDHAKRNRGRYDAVCSFQVLEHVADPRSFLEAAMSCLRPGGLLIVSVPSYDSFLRRAPNLVLNMPPHHVTLWSDRALLGMAGLLKAQALHLEHEKVAPYHLLWYLQCLLYRLLRGRRAEERGMLVLDRSGRILLKTAMLLSRLLYIVVGPLARTLPQEFLPDGHTVLLVLRKTGD